MTWRSWCSRHGKWFPSLSALDSEGRVVGGGWGGGKEEAGTHGRSGRRPARCSASPVGDASGGAGVAQSLSRGCWSARRAPWPSRRPARSPACRATGTARRRAACAPRPRSSRRRSPGSAGRAPRGSSAGGRPPAARARRPRRTWRAVPASAAAALRRWRTPRRRWPRARRGSPAAARRSRAAPSSVECALHARPILVPAAAGQSPPLHAARFDLFRLSLDSRSRDAPRRRHAIAAHDSYSRKQRRPHRMPKPCIRTQAVTPFPRRSARPSARSGSPRTPHFSPRIGGPSCPRPPRPRRAAPPAEPRSRGTTAPGAKHPRR